MNKQVAVITGATSGIGKAVIKQLSKKKLTIVALGRNKQKGNQLVAELNSGSSANIHFYTCDLNSQSQIRTVAKELTKKFPVIHYLINNAGIWTSGLEYTEEHIEKQFGVNHIAHFLLTHLLLPALRKAEQGKILTVSSESHKYGVIHFDDVNLTDKYHGLKAYGQSKLANLLFMKEFERRNPYNSILSYAISPGLVKTDIGVKHTNLFHSFMWKLRRLGGKSPQKAAAYIIDYLFEDKFNKSGQYWENGKVISASKTANNEVVADHLWVLSKKLTNIKNFFR